MGNLWQKFSWQQSIWLTILTLSSFWGGKANLTQAQIIPDDTLGAESSIVNQIDATLQEIDGGAIRGGNLFHSFLEFSINEGNAAYFTNPAEVLNIFSRVTGNNISQILGTLGVLGNANLYLINPNGILFGPNAQLDIAGSFIASSSNSVIFPNGAEFSATNPQAPPLLTVNTSTPVGLKFEGIPGTITSQAELITAPQKTIALVGGEINIEGGAFMAEDGRIELGSVGNNSIVNFTISDLGLLALDYSQANNFTDLSLSDFASVDTSGDRGGEIQLQGQNITLGDETKIISTTLGTEDGGNLTFNANESIKLTGVEIISESRGEGNGGNIIFNSNQMNLSDEAFIRADAYGVGDGGDIIINTTGLLELKAQSFIETESWGEGIAGNIVINIENLSVQELAFINSTANGIGKGGDLIINALESINLALFGLTTQSNQFNTNATGNAGDVFIEAKQINITDGGNIASISFGDGLSGNINIKASDSIKLSGFFDAGFQIAPSGIFSFSFGLGESGNSGDITIQTPTLIIEDGAAIQNSTLGGGKAGDIFIEANLVELNASEVSLQGGINSQTAEFPSATGDAGNITIETQQLNISGGAQISVASRNGSQGGDINIKASESIIVSGTFPNATLTFGQSGIFVSAQPAVVEEGEIIISAGGNSGNLIIETNNLLVEKGAKISADTFGLGKSGTITLNVNQLQVLDGGLIRAASSVEENAPTLERGNGGSLNITATESVTISGIGNIGEEVVESSLVTESQGINGNAGVLTINTPQLIISNQGIVSASTSGQNADANNIVINNANSVTIDNGLISSAVNEGAIGNGGTITINTNNLALQNGGVATASTSGEGNAGNVIINAENINILDGSNISAFTESQMQGNAGEIKIQETQTIFISGGSSIQTFTSNIGEAGDIFIDTQAITISEDSDISAFTSGKGNAGNIIVNATESMTLNTNTKLIVESSGAGTAGKINIDTPLLTIGENAQLSATATETSTSEKAGDIILNVNQLNIAGELGIFAETRSTATAGSLEIQPYQTNPNLNIQFTDDGFISARTTDIGDGGSITITAPENIDIRGDGSITAETFGSGTAGNITINSQNLSIADGVNISTSTESSGNPGIITVNATENIFLTNQAKITSEVGEGATGDSQGIIVNSPQLTLSDNSQISAATEGEGKAGNILVESKDSVIIDSGSILNVETQSSDNAGDIDINADIISIGENAELSARTTNQGDAGDITLNTNQLNISGQLGIFAETQAEGNAGELIINPVEDNPNLTISFSNQGKISASTLASGDGGSINIIASENIDMRGDGSITAETSGSGRAGTITIDSQNLTLTDGIKINASTSSSGDSGNINLFADNINLDNATIQALTNAEGNPGSILISNGENNANQVNLSNNSTISTEINDEGNRETAQLANININTDNLFLDSSKITASTNANRDAGDITIVNSKEISLNNNSQITALTTDSGNAGNINLSVEKEINIDSGSILNVETLATGEAGDIDINADIISIGENAELSARTTNQGNAGDITLNTNQLNISGQLGIFAETQAEGNAGELIINPVEDNPNLTISFSNQGKISASTLASGKGGNINITAEENINISGDGIIAVETQGSGNAGTINITSQNLNLTDNITITASTLGSGNAGNINLSANSINLNKAEINAFTDGMGNAGQIIIPNADRLSLNNNSKISTAIAPSGIANKPSNIEITASQVFLNNNSQITAETEGEGKGGNINLNAQQLTLENGSRINTTTSGESQAGNINLTVSEEVNIMGTNTGILADTTAESKGKGGNIDLETPELLIEKGGIIAVDSLGEGEGGNITISNNNLNLNEGEISAETTSGDGGNINLTIQEFLIMRNNSKISTTAGNQQTGGNGGNINIFARYILAIPEENSDITANAFTGKGGQIFITTEAIFGIEPRNELTLLSDITASSELGVDGIIEITRLNVDPLEGLTNLPETRADVVVAQGCDVGGEGSISFYDLGKGGLPAKPGDYLIIDDIFTPWIRLTNEVNPQSWNLEKNKSVKISDSDANIILTFSCGDD